MPQPNFAEYGVCLGHAAQDKDRCNPEEDAGDNGNRRQAPNAHKQGNKGAGHNQFPFSPKYMGMAVQRLVDGEITPHIAP